MLGFIGPFTKLESAIESAIKTRSWLKPALNEQNQPYTEIQTYQHTHIYRHTNPIQKVSHNSHTYH